MSACTYVVVLVLSVCVVVTQYESKATNGPVFYAVLRYVAHNRYRT
jgi:hypothetical protein